MSPSSTSLKPTNKHVGLFKFPERAWQARSDHVKPNCSSIIKRRRITLDLVGGQISKAEPITSRHVFQPARESQSEPSRRKNRPFIRTQRRPSKKILENERTL
ncbi:hypothetical protein SLE2022_183480 [Rubroshorea leprosula]